VSPRIIDTEHAPRAIGSYSQAIESRGFVFLSGQIPLDPKSMERVHGSFEDQLNAVFENLRQVAKAAGGELSDIVKLTIYLTDLANYPAVNEGMTRFFEAPFPARAVIGVAALPLESPVEVEAVMSLGSDETYSY